ncbi:MAG TPA: hypothetical protein VK570_10755 [Rubrivivax sp.]|nr:hypothetical protein [Rubrivivax sp.]
MDTWHELNKLLYRNGGRPAGPGRVVADKQRLWLLTGSALTFCCGGAIGALGFNKLGTFSVRLALLLIGLAGVPAHVDLLALARPWRRDW